MAMKQTGLTREDLGGGSERRGRAPHELQRALNLADRVILTHGTRSAEKSSKDEELQYLLVDARKKERLEADFGRQERRLRGRVTKGVCSSERQVRTSQEADKSSTHEPICHPALGALPNCCRM